MVALWVIIGLIISAVSVSSLGAAFSVLGLAVLFSGAATAVMAMAASLEVAKFVLAAYLHQRWHDVNLFLKTYLLIAIVVLSAITSMGIFGFLSDAYQSASAVLEAENIKLESLQTQKNRVTADLNRIHKALDEIPPNQTTKRFKARAEMEPQIAVLSKQVQQIDEQITQSNLQILEVKKKVGPLIYISRSFKIDVDTVVKYLILLLVCVFDPLAICLVIAMSEALESRKKAQLQPQAVATELPLESASDEIIQMRFTGDDGNNAV